MSDGKGCKCCASCYSECSCEDVDRTPQEVIDLRAEIASLAKQSAKMREALEEVASLIGESSGVYGLHLNGDNSPWSEIEQGGFFERLISLPDALALPDLATPVINRIKAEGMREAAEIAHCIAMQRPGTAMECEVSIRAKANELEGK